MTRHHVRRDDGTWEEVDEPLVTKTGKVLTNDVIEALADEAERGYEVLPDAMEWSPPERSSDSAEPRPDQP